MWSWPWTGHRQTQPGSSRAAGGRAHCKTLVRFPRSLVLILDAVGSPRSSITSSMVMPSWIRAKLARVKRGLTAGIEPGGAYSLTGVGAASASSEEDSEFSTAALSSSLTPAPEGAADGKHHTPTAKAKIPARGSTATCQSLPRSPFLAERLGTGFGLLIHRAARRALELRAAGGLPLGKRFLRAAHLTLEHVGHCFPSVSVDTLRAATAGWSRGARRLDSRLKFRLFLRTKR